MFQDNNDSGECTNNRFYNNIFWDVQSTEGRSVFFWRAATGTTTISKNELVNNVFLGWEGDRYGVGIENDDNIIDNIFRRNIYFSAEDSTIVRVANTQINVDEWNGYDGTKGYTVSGEMNFDPGLSNPSKGEFWPQSSDAAVVGNGYDLGPPYNFVIQPDRTDFLAFPPIVEIVKQPAVNWYVGAYALEGSGDGGPDGGDLDGGTLDGGTLDGGPLDGGQPDGDRVDSVFPDAEASNPDSDGGGEQSEGGCSCYIANGRPVPHDLGTLFVKLFVVASLGG